MNKKILAAAIAATCAIGAVHTQADAAEKSKSQSLGDLSCLENQVAGFDGEFWACIDKPLDGVPGPQGQQGEPGPQGPAGDGGAPGYEFVDGDGNVLGDVLFIEDKKTAWGYFDYLSANSIIRVTAPIDKAGFLFSGNFIQVLPGVYYLDDACSGTAYAAPQKMPASEVQMLEFLVTDPFLFWQDTHNDSWTEVILSDRPGPDTEINWYLKSTPDGPCGNGGYTNGSEYREVVSFRGPFAIPVLPIIIVEKP